MKQLKKTISLTLAALLLLASCSSGQTNTETEQQTGEPTLIDPSVQPAPGGTTETPTSGIDFAALTSDTVASWAEAEPFDFAAANASSYVQLGQVEGLAVTKASPVLTDEEFENELDSLMENYSYSVEITDRAVEEGDTVRADYAGYKDGEAFGGGTAYDQEITAQGGTGYIEGFAEAFIGQTPGEEFSFNVTFPENYGVDDLNGQEVTFVCTVHGILTDEEIVPELNDEFVSSKFGYDTVDAFLEVYRLSVEKRKEESVRSKLYNDLWSMLVSGAEVLSLPESEVRRIYASQRASYEEYASYYNTDYATFLASYVNTTDEELYRDAESYVKEDLVLYALADRMGVDPTDEEYDAGIEELAGFNGMTAEDMKDYYG
ncbi:MAG: FKBP-type peptidyl-prolyl cis-trans isomerase, partial [Clostridia bacterium]|nr:FKBP-type peptidyl-prolyl cis-trans isomerase [Clostridia bacterium]